EGHLGTWYLLASSPYGNGSWLLRMPSEEFVLYCSCGTPVTISHCTWGELSRYSVRRAAHECGYGSPEGIVAEALISSPCALACPPECLPINTHDRQESSLKAARTGLTETVERPQP